MENKKIEHWKSQLLDTGKRNKMINYKETSRTTLKIVEPSIESLYENYVKKENILIFQYPLDENINACSIHTMMKLRDRFSSSNQLVFGDIKVDTSFQESIKTLKNLRSKSKLAIEEQGINILYLSLGFIQWQEGKGSHKTLVKSPLILVPVSLNVTSFKSPFKLARYDDEVVVNPTLQHIFLSDYGIKLPFFDSEKTNIEDYLKEIEDIANEKGWKVIREASIGLLSFLKINMYRDIITNIEKIHKNPVLKAMLGDSSELVNISEELINYNHDNLMPKDCFQVLSADSSQQDAIELSKRGISFVMQGPPGTGKSQTITNIISEALAAGKKILFVSEKMAALQVVYRRLSELGLSEFCLDLHSHKANKKQILNDIQNTLSLKKNYVKKEVIEELDRLYFDRKELNKYVKELHKVIPPLNISCYDVYGILENLNIKTDFIFNIENVDKITREELNERLYSLENFENYKNNLGFDLKNNPWSEVVISSLTFEDNQKIEKNINLIINDLERLVLNSDNLNKEYDLKKINKLKEYNDFIEILKKIFQIPILPEIIFEAENINELEEFTLKAEYKMNELIKEKETLNSWFNFNIYEIDTQRVKTIINKVEKLKEIFEPSVTFNIEKNIDKVYEEISNLFLNLTNLGNIGKVDLHLLNLNIINNLHNLSLLFEIVSEIKRCVWRKVQHFRG